MKFIFISSFLILLVVNSVIGGCGKFCNYGSENHTETEQKLLKYMDSDEVTSQFSSFFHGLPHINNNGRNIGNDWDPSNMGYLTAVGLTGAPFAAIYVLLGFASTIAICVKCCTTFLCKNKKRYSKRANCCGKLFAFFTGLLICAVIALALVSNQTIHDGIVDSVNRYTIEQQRIFHTLNSVETVLDEMNNTQATEISLEFSSFTNASNEWTMAQHYLDEYALYSEFYRNIVVCCLIGIGFLILCAFSLSCCVSSKCSTFCFSSFILLFVPVLFLICAVHVPGAVFVADMCPELDAYIQNETNAASYNSDQNITQYFLYYTQCQDMSLNPLMKVNDTVYAYLELAEMALQEAIDNNESNSTIDELQGYVNYLTILDNDITILSDCNSTSNSWNNIRQNICVELLDGIGYLSIFCIILAFFFWTILTTGFILVNIWRSTKIDDDKQYFALAVASPKPNDRRNQDRLNNNNNRGSMRSYNTFEDDRDVVNVVIESSPFAPPPPYQSQLFVPPSMASMVTINQNPFEEQVIVEERVIYEPQDNFKERGVMYESQDNFNAYPILYPNVAANPTAPPNERD